MFVQKFISYRIVYSSSSLGKKRINSLLIKSNRKTNNKRINLLNSNKGIKAIKFHE